MHVLQATLFEERPYLLPCAAAALLCALGLLTLPWLRVAPILKQAVEEMTAASAMPEKELREACSSASPVGRKCHCKLPPHVKCFAVDGWRPQECEWHRKEPSQGLAAPRGVSHA